MSEPAGRISLQEVFEHYFDDGEKTERARDYPSESHEAQRQDRKVHQHAQLKADQLPQGVAASSLLAFHVADPGGAGILRDLENETVDVRIGIARFGPSSATSRVMQRKLER